MAARVHWRRRDDPEPPVQPNCWVEGNGPIHYEQTVQDLPEEMWDRGYKYLAGGPWTPAYGSISRVQLVSSRYSFTIRLIGYGAMSPIWRLSIQIASTASR
jgi:hypothetical protein